MSLTSSRPPEADFSRTSHNQQFQNHDPNQKPIMRLMRLQKSYLVQQHSSVTPPPHTSNITQTGQLKTLRQFQRSLQKQRPTQIQIPNSNFNNSFHNSTIKSSAIVTPKGQFKEKFVSSFMINESTIPNEEDNDIAFNHRVMQTQKYGNENLDKIKKMIVDQKPSRSPKSPKRRKRIQPFFYNAASSTQKLHNSYLKTEQDRRNQYIKKYYVDQMRQVKPFKIDNPMSQFLADQRAEKQGTVHKPLYERSIQLARQMEQSRLQKHLQAEEQRRLKKQQEDRELEEIQKQKFPGSATKQRQQQFYNQMMQRQKQKNQQKQQSKIQHLKQAVKQKPFVSKGSQQLFNKIVQNKNIPKDFVQRNMEYRAEREKEKIKELEKHNQEYCPFAPVISQASREKAKKHYQRIQKKQQSSKKDCHKDMVLQTDELKKRLNMIQLRIKERKNMAQENLNKQKRASSALPMGVKSQTARDKQKDNIIGKIKHNRDGLSDRKAAELREQDIPVYNKSDYRNRRTNSCFNLKK